MFFSIPIILLFLLIGYFGWEYVEEKYCINYANQKLAEKGIVIQLPEEFKNKGFAREPFRVRSANGSSEWWELHQSCHSHRN